MNDCAMRLPIISKIIESWLDWDRNHRRDENLVTDRDTSIMCLPVPFWPSHGQFQNWIDLFEKSAAEIKRLGTRADALCESLLDHRCIVDSSTTVRECIGNSVCGCCDGLLLKEFMEGSPLTSPRGQPHE